MSDQSDRPGNEMPYGGSPGNYPPYPYPPPRRMSKVAKVFLIIGIVIIVGFFFMVGLSVLAVIGGVGAEFASSGGLEEHILQASDVPNAGKIAVIDLSFAIFGKGSHMSGHGTSYQISRQLRKAAEDDKVKAVVLQVDSPGGGLTASDIIYNEVRRFQETDKPVVVSIGSMAASGGYYIAVPCDYIVAGPTSMVGSIGVIMNRFEIQELLKMIGIKAEPIKSTEMKDIGSPFRPLTDEERNYFQELISFYHERFVGIVADGRDLPKDKVKELANGKIYTADQALEYSLIDEIGYFETALDKARELGNAQDAGVIRYEEAFSFKTLAKSLPCNSSVSSLLEVQMFMEAALDMASAPQVRAVWNGSVTGD